ncbi:MAG: amidohydrolase family protein [Candidatus Cloacimonetes bacterium]|nr:amidohydrolase family protein [Candidatus Cloacimonadota bacterium]
MKIKVSARVQNPDTVIKKSEIRLKSKLLKENELTIEKENVFAYPPFINSHDHLIGNWFPRNGENRPYPNSDVWVKEMQFAKPLIERHKVWINDSNFDLSKGNAHLLTMLGIYKNIFSGCGIVQDHISKQKNEYYNKFPINVLKNYTQCHSISLGNWWGDKSALEEWQESKLKMPFVLHLAEGIDENAQKDFQKLKDSNLLQPNTLIVHGIALTKQDIKECAEVGASICWCPGSNQFLIGRSIDVPFCLKKGIKVVLGTDSTQSGSLNILTELKCAHKMFPEIKYNDLYRMISTTACKSLYLSEESCCLDSESSNLLLVSKKCDDPFENLHKINFWDIEFLVYKGKPIYGNKEWLEYFNIKSDDYFFFSNQKYEKFVIGHPEIAFDEIDSYLGYHQKFPFIPFS